MLQNKKMVFINKKNYIKGPRFCEIIIIWGNWKHPVLQNSRLREQLKYIDRSGIYAILHFYILIIYMSVANLSTLYLCNMGGKL